MGERWQGVTAGVQNWLKSLGIWPSIFVGAILTIPSGMFLSLLLNNAWVVNPNHPYFTEFRRNVATGTVESSQLAQAMDWQLLLLFLGGVLLVGMGTGLPFFYLFNRRLLMWRRHIHLTPALAVLLRQSFWWGLIVAFSVWMQIHRTFGVAVIGLVVVVFVLLEGLLLIRRYSAELNR